MSALIIRIQMEDQLIATRSRLVIIITNCIIIIIMFFFFLVFREYNEGGQTRTETTYSYGN
jgi:hypothetical protein